MKLDFIGAIWCNSNAKFKPFTVFIEQKNLIMNHLQKTHMEAMKISNFVVITLKFISRIHYFYGI